MRPNLQAIAGALTTMLEGRPGDWVGYRHSKAAMARTVWAGVFFELAPDAGSEEIATYAGIKSHTTIISYIEQWYQLSWELRYSWLIFARGYVFDGWHDTVRDELGRLATALEEMESGEGEWRPREFKHAFRREGRPKIRMGAIKKLKRSISDEEDS